MRYISSFWNFNEIFFRYDLVLKKILDDILLLIIVVNVFFSCVKFFFLIKEDVFIMKIL